MNSQRACVYALYTAICVFGVLFIWPKVLLPQQSTGITWADKRLVSFLVPGLVISEHLQFTSTVSEKDLDIFLSPEIAPFVSALPSHFTSLSPGGVYDLTVQISIPASASVPSVFQGTLHVRKSSRTIATPFQIALIIDAAASRLPKSTDIVKTAGDRFVANEIIITLRRGFGLADAQIIASSIGASVVGAVPSINTVNRVLGRTLLTSLTTLIAKTAG